jgi:cytosine deaminase
MSFDLVIRNARLAAGAALMDIAVRNGRIAELASQIRCEAVEEVDARGAFAFSGFVDAHVHLDKACILDRCHICEGTLAEAVRETAQAKASFTEEDVYQRAARVVEKAITHGTTAMRSFVEIDPRAGYRSFLALKRVRDDFAFAIDIQLCAFAQEGLTQEPQTLSMLNQALEEGADLVGGCPYTDPDPAQHVRLIFDLAQKHNVDVDFHLDFDLDPGHTNLPAVIDETVRRGWAGRVTIGHVTNLTAMPLERVAAIAGQLAKAGIALVALPATDLFLTGRQSPVLTPRGVAPLHRLAADGVITAVATNNVLNPFTPYGDASLVRMANLYANIAQLSREEDMRLAFSMVTALPDRIVNRSAGPATIEVGQDATIVLLDAPEPASAVREVARVIGGWKAGRKSFWNGWPSIFHPG